MLAAGDHAGLRQPKREGPGQRRYHARIGIKGAVANHVAAAMVQIEHWSKTHVHAAGTQLGRQHKTTRRGQVHGL